MKGEKALAKKKSKEEKSLIDEVIDLKFGKGAWGDSKKRSEIMDYLENLYIELDMLNDDDDEEEPVVIRRYCHFSTFKEHTHDRWERFNGKIKEARIKEVQKIIDYYKAKLDEYENQLKGLKGENK